MLNDMPVISSYFQTRLFFHLFVGNVFMSILLLFIHLLIELFIEDLRPLPRSDFCSILVSNLNAKQILLKVCQKKHCKKKKRNRKAN